MDQSRLNFINSFYINKNNSSKYHVFLETFELIFDKKLEKPVDLKNPKNLEKPKFFNNSYYYKSMVDKDKTINFKLGLVKTYQFRKINNIIFF